MGKILKKLVVTLLCMFLVGSIFEKNHVYAAEDTTWQSEWSHTLKTYNGENIIVLRRYNGSSSTVEVPAKAVVDGTEYQVWVRDPEKKGYDALTPRSVQTLSFEEGVKAGKYLTNLFTQTELVEVDLTGLDTSATVDMQNMFAGNQYLKRIELGDIDTSNVTNMSRMFANCEGLRELDVSKMDVSGIDPSKGGTMRGIFDFSFIIGDPKKNYVSSTNHFGKSIVRSDHEYPYPAWAQETYGDYGIDGVDGIERVYSILRWGEFPGTIGTGTNYYKSIDSSELDLTEDQIAQIAATLLYIDEVPIYNEYQSVFYDIQCVIWSITGSLDLDDPYMSSPAAKEYYENTVLTRYKDIKGVYQMNTYAPENGDLEYLVGNARIVKTSKLILTGKAVLTGRDYESGDELTFTISSADPNAPLPKETEVTVNPTSGTEVSFAFPAIEYGYKDIGNTYRYTVKQTGKGRTLILDSKRHYVNVTVSAKDGELVTNVEYTDGEELLFQNKYIDEFVIRKQDQYKEPVKDAKFAVYGKPTFETEKKIKITKVRNYHEIKDVGDCPPRWKLGPVEPDDGCPTPLPAIEEAYIQQEIDVVVEGIDETEFYEEFTLAKDETSHEITLKTGKYKVSEKVPTIEVEGPMDQKEQSYLLSYEFEIDELGEVKGSGDAEWLWLSGNNQSGSYKTLENPTLPEWNEQVSVQTTEDEIIITNYAGVVEYLIKVTKVRDYPKTEDEEDPCPSPVVPGPAGQSVVPYSADSGCNGTNYGESDVPEVHVEGIYEGGEEHSDQQESEVPEVHVELYEEGNNQQESDVPEVHVEQQTEDGCDGMQYTQNTVPEQYVEPMYEDGCNGTMQTNASNETAQMSEEEAIAYHYFNPNIKITFTKDREYCTKCKAVDLTANENSYELRLRAGDYIVSELQLNPAVPTDVEKEQSYLTHVRIRVNYDGTVEILYPDEVYWSWDNSTGYVRYDDPTIAQWKDKVSFEVNGNEVKITNFAYRIEHPKVPEPCHPKVPEPCHPVPPPADEGTKQK